MPRITVCLPGRPQQSFDCAAGENLYRTLAARRLMDAPCGGMGKCGKCRVRLPDSPPPAQPEDRRFFTADELHAGWRLACLHTVEGDITVELPAREAVSDIVSSGLTRPAEGLPVVRKERTAQGGTRLLRLELQALDEPGDTAERLFGIAVDIGTTTIVAALVDLCTGQELLSASCVNSQSVYGQDVMSRIQYAGQPGGAAELRDAVLRDLQSLLGHLYSRNTAGVRPDHVYEIAIAANNTMIHLLLGADPSGMGRTPYRPALHGAQTCPASVLGLPASPACMVYCLPAVSAFVGGDITAGVLTCGLDRTDRTVLFIDIGTNGEIVLSRGGRMYACSCAAGPALEGMNISCGMRAAAGAVEDVHLADRDGTLTAMLTVIGNTAPRGLCGSGLLAAIAQLRAHGIIQPTGRLQTHPLVDVVDGKKRVVLDASAGIILTQNDIRQVQLAKGALLSGIQTMMRFAGIGPSEIDEMLVAGQFGAHLKVESLVGAGIIPAALGPVVRYVGNTSKSGAMLCLLSRDERKRVEDIAGRIDYVELSALDGYEKVFVQAMKFQEE